MIFVERNYEINDQKMFVIVKVCKKWRHYIKNVKYFVRMIIDHVNFKNFFINKILNRRETRWWKRLAELDLKIKYRFKKSNLANDSFHKRDYENETAKKNKNNENLNLRKWVLIESKSIFKSKNEKKKKELHFVNKQSTCIFVEYRQHRIKDIRNNRRNVEKQLFREQWFSKLRRIFNR
jgi:hypothetical protein